MDYGARFYDPTISRWQTIDPLAEKNNMLSPFNFCSNNPINRTDLNGMLDDWYTVDNMGNINLEKKTDDNFDNLYSKKDFDAGNTNRGIQVNDKSILPALAGESNIQNMDWIAGYKETYPINPETGRKTLKYVPKKMIDGHYAETNSKKDAQNIFKFAASNSNVEWSISGNKDRKWAIGTLHENSLALVFDDLGDSYKSKNIIYDAHSHPGNTVDDFRPSGNDMSRAIYQKKANPNSSTWLFMPKHPTSQWLKLK